MRMLVSAALKAFAYGSMGYVGAAHSLHSFLACHADRVERHLPRGRCSVAGDRRAALKRRAVLHERSRQKARARARR